MKRYATIAMVTALVLLLLPAAVSAEPGQGRRMGRGSGMGLRGVELTAEQRQKLDEIRVNLAKEIEPLRAEVKVKQVELEALWRAEKPDAKKVIAKVREISGVREKLAVVRANFRLAMHNLLTPEQRAKLAARGEGHGPKPGRRGEGPRMRGKDGCRGECDDCHGHGPADKK